VIILMIQNVFRPHEDEKPELSNSSALKNVFKQFRFRARLVWTVDLPVKITRALNSPNKNL